MIRNLFLLLFLITGISLSAQDFSISGTIVGLENQDVYLLQITGDNRKIVDTVQSDITGSFIFELEQDFPVGQYAVLAGPGQMIELLFNNENIQFVTTGSSANDQVQIIESVENLIYYDYLNIKGMNLYKLDLLYPVVEYYPKDDEFYKSSLTKVMALQNQINERVEKLVSENPNTLSSRVLRVDRPIFADPQMSLEMQKLYLKSNYFKDEDFLDTLLLNTNILTGKIISYLQLYQDQRLSQEALEQQLIMAVDTVLAKAFVDQQVYEFVINFLIRGFEAIGFEKGLEHIANHNLLAELCVNTERKEELENKMELIKKLAIGQPAPDLEAVDFAGNNIRLSEVLADKILLVFWASWCPHCNDILPTIKEFYDPENTAKLQVIGISIDESETEWRKAVDEYGYNWINIAELKGWNGPIIDEYGIVATPTFFVLDKEKNIIAKPANNKDMRETLK